MPGHQNSGALSSWQLFFYCNLENGHQEYQFVFFLKCIYVSLTFFGYIRILPAKIKDTQPRKHQKNCGGTRVLVPGHQNSGALSSWQLVFYCNLENGHQNYQFVFFPKGIYEFFAFCGNIRILPAKLRIHNKENTKKIVGAPEFWCPGTRTLVPFQVENRFFVLISRMGFRNINFSFFLSVFMCSGHFLVLSEHCQHKCENTIKKTPQKMWGHQSSGAPYLPYWSWVMTEYWIVGKY